MGSKVLLTTGHSTVVPQHPDEFLDRLEHHRLGGAPVMLIEEHEQLKGFVVPMEVSGAVPADGVPEDFFALLVGLGDALAVSYYPPDANLSSRRRRALELLDQLSEIVGFENISGATTNAIAGLREIVNGQL